MRASFLLIRAAILTATILGAPVLAAEVPQPDGASVEELTPDRVSPPGLRPPDHLPAGALPPEQIAALQGMECVDCPHCDTCQPGLGVCVHTICPRWSVEVGAVFLHRSAPGGMPFLGQDEPGEVIFLESEAGWASGPRIEIGRDIRCVGRLELTYFGYNDGTSPYVAEVDTYVDDEVSRWQSLVSEYWSDLHSTELNLKRPLIREMNWLIGFRWIEMEDRLEGTLYQEQLYDHELEDSRLSWLSARMYNHLYGLQVGLDGTVWQFSPNLRATGFLKGGIYGDMVSGIVTAQETFGGRIRRDNDFGRAAFVGELGLAATYCLTKRLTATAGYQAIWMQGVSTLPGALAPDRDEWTDGSPSYHGAFCGLEACW